MLLQNASLSTKKKLFLACSGNGSQWQGMGLDLYAYFPRFQKALDQCSEFARRDLYHVIQYGFQTALDEVLSIVAIQVGLIELLKEFQIIDEITGYLGHSSGEIVCSYLDGLTDLQETMSIAFARGIFANRIQDKGLMLSVSISLKEAAQILKDPKYDQTLCIACINSPQNVTFAGEPESILQLASELQKQKIFNRFLHTQEKAYHSFLMKKHEEKLFNLLACSMKNEKRLRSKKWISTIAGCKDHVFDPKYHVKSMIEPVDFYSAIQKVPSNSVILEIGPHPILERFILETRDDLDTLYLMKRGANQLECLKMGFKKLEKLGFHSTLDEPILVKISV